MNFAKQWRGYDPTEVEQFLESMEINRRESLREYQERYLCQKDENRSLMEDIFKAIDELQTYYSQDEDIVNILLGQSESLKSTYNQGRELIEIERRKYQEELKELEEISQTLNKAKSILNLS